MAIEASRTNAVKGEALVKELTRDRFAKTEVLFLAEFLHTTRRVCAGLLPGLVVWDRFDHGVDEFIHRFGSNQQLGFLDRPFLVGSGK